jgi:hypothetical protein
MAMHEIINLERYATLTLNFDSLATTRAHLRSVCAYI